ncbi:glycosyl hydrolase family 92-domain-containing protein [Mycena olivaceomarginata]|nr:glycosyl hydrolase family 92-domain-containing protein [Mycena olivaceomarginata]
MPTARRPPCSYSYEELVALPFNPYKLEGPGSLYFPLRGTTTSDIDAFIDGTPAHSSAIRRAGDQSRRTTESFTRSPTWGDLKGFKKLVEEVFLDLGVPLVCNSVTERNAKTIRRAMLGTPGTSASRLLEYAYNDFSIALVAQGLNSTMNATHFFNKSSDWFNLWNFNASNTGFAGFIQLQNADGSWFFDSRFDRNGVCFARTTAARCSGIWIVSWIWQVLVQAMGGADTFRSVGLVSLYLTLNIKDVGDEPGFLPTYLYNYVGQPVKLSTGWTPRLHNTTNTR